MFETCKHFFAKGALAAALLFFWTGAHAMWERLSQGDLIQKSSLIVVGTLAEVTNGTQPTAGRKRAIGVIEVETVLKGSPKTKFVRLALPHPEAPVSSTDLSYRVGQKGLWFLHLLAPKGAAIYAADHPQRFVPFASAGPHIEAVRNFLER